ncbi:MAG: VOC family protein [Lysobacteraceae bacterium]
MRMTFSAPVLPVADLDRALAWYRDRLGFAIEFVHAGHYAGIVRDGCRIHLKCGMPVRADREAFAAGGHVDLCIGVDDAGAVAKAFAGAVGEVAVPLREASYGREIYLRDPEGNLLALVQAA